MSCYVFMQFFVAFYV